MQFRPKNMPRWEWKKSLEEEKKDLTIKKSLEIPEKSNILGITITTLVMVAIVWIIFASMNGGSDNSCGQGYHWEEDFRGTVGGCVHD